MKSFFIQLLCLISTIFLLQGSESNRKRVAGEELKQVSAKRARSKIERMRRSVGKNELGQPIQSCLRCNNFQGYHFQVSEHMHNDCFPSNGLFLLDSDSTKQVKMPKFVDLVAHHSAHAEPRWKCIYCSSLVSPKKFKKHFELNTKLQMALYIFQGCNENIYLGRNSFNMSSARQKLEEEEKEVANLLADLNIIIARSK
jgi:hypothetical protein